MQTDTDHDRSLVYVTILKAKRRGYTTIELLADTELSMRDIAEHVAELMKRGVVVVDPHRRRDGRDVLVAK